MSSPTHREPPNEDAALFRLRERLRRALGEDRGLQHLVLEGGALAAWYADEPLIWTSSELRRTLGLPSTPTLDPTSRAALQALAERGPVLVGEPLPVQWDLPGGRGVVTHARATVVQDGASRLIVSAHTPAPHADPLATAAPAGMTALLDALPVLVWSTTPQGMCDFVNSGYSEYTGLPREALLGFGWAAALHAEDRVAVGQAWAASAAQGLPFETTFRLRRADGTYRRFEARAVPMRDADGRIERWVGTNTDVEVAYAHHDLLQVANDALEARVAERTRALREAHDRLAEAQAIAHLGSWSLDLRTDHLEWSDELFRILGLPGPLPPPVTEHARLFTAESWARLSAALAAARDGSPGYDLELDVVRADGRPTVARALATLQADAEGRPARLVGTFHDVTDRVLASRERDAANARAHVAAQAAGMGVWDWNIPNDTLAWDVRMYALFGVDPATTTTGYHLWRDALHPADREEAEAAVHSALTRRAELDTAFRIVRGDGAVRVVRAAGRALLDAHGNVERLTGVNWDITEERERERRLASTLSLLDEFVRRVPVAIALLDTEKRFVLASDRFLADYALEGVDPSGRSLVDVFPFMAERWNTLADEVLAGGTVGEREDEIPFPDGSVGYLSWEAHHWRDDMGEIAGIVVSSQWVTNRREMERQLRGKQSALEQSNRDLEQFASAASHDLQEPLRAIAGCAQLLRPHVTRLGDPHADELLGHITDGAARMRTLTQDLLAFARVPGANASIAPTALTEVVGECLRDLRTSIEECAARVLIGDLPTVTADRTQLALVLRGLLGNALKYREPGRSPTIQVTAHREDRAWRVEVRDDGIGIDPAYFDRIFGLFQRLHTRTAYPGSGIGLAICQRIVERHGGRIGVRSAPGAGATFWFTLPDGEGV